MPIKTEKPDRPPTPQTNDLKEPRYPPKLKPNAKPDNNHPNQPKSTKPAPMHQSDMARDTIFHKLQDKYTFPTPNAQSHTFPQFSTSRGHPTPKRRTATECDFLKYQELHLIYI